MATELISGQARYGKITAQFEWVDPELAALWLKDKNKKNRKVSERNLSGIVADMKNMDWKQTGDSIKFSVTGLMLDSQHRLLGVVASKVKQVFLVVRGLPDDAHKYIDKGKKRSAADVLGIEGVENATSMASIIQFVIAFKKGAYSDAMTGSGGRGVRKGSHSDVSDFAAKYKNKLSESFRVGHQKDARLVISMNRLAALHFLFSEVDKAKADEFCDKLVSGADLKTNSPIRQVRQLLLNNMQASRPLPDRIVVATVIKGFNFFRSGKPVTQVRYIKTEPFPKIRQSADRILRDL